MFNQPYSQLDLYHKDRHQAASQYNRLLELFRYSYPGGVNVWEMNTPRPKGGLGIAQYNRIIKMLRDDGYNIKCVRPGFYRLETYSRL